MSFRVFLVLLLWPWLLVFGAWAAYSQQQSQLPVSPSEVAIAISSNVNALASALENANRQIKTLTEQKVELEKQCKSEKFEKPVSGPPGK